MQNRQIVAAMQLRAWNFTLSLSLSLSLSLYSANTIQPWEFFLSIATLTHWKNLQILKTLTTAFFLLIMETLNGCGENQCDVDQDPKLQNIIDAVQDEATKKALMDLAVRFRKKQIEDNERFDQIFNLYNEIYDRLREQEKYSSKDSFVIENPPFNSRDSENFFMNLKIFFHEYLKLDLKEENLKAFHVLPTRRNLPDTCDCKVYLIPRKRDSL